MKNDKLRHNFHIPVMGTGYTINTPIKVAQYGISSVVSIVDDSLMEKLREFYCNKFSIPFSPINTDNKDYRAERITSYLDTMDDIVSMKFENLKKNISEKKKAFEDFVNNFPDCNSLKNEAIEKIKSEFKFTEIKDWVNKNIIPGNIDVNIMTKVDKQNHFEGESLDTEYNDAHSALRGYAQSKTSSSLVLSAGMNLKLYGYIEKFKDFFPDINGNIKKKIILKVSDYKSALVQGKFLAKKGIWVSEFRIESGLNCGGHAFVSNGSLIGVILEEFKSKKEQLKDLLFKETKSALEKKNIDTQRFNPKINITAQGGVGTSEEHNFLISNYNLKSVGWGSPFLMATDVCDIDNETLDKIENSKPNDYYLSHASPLGVRFNNIDFEKNDQDATGYKCTKAYMAFNTEFTEKPICTATKFYKQKKKEQILNSSDSSESKNKQIKMLEAKTCLCNGLAKSILVKKGIDSYETSGNLSICPGPNMAYFNKRTNLNSLIKHIYGKKDILNNYKRPHMFIQELVLNLEYLKELISSSQENIDKQAKTIKKNLLNGIEYYKELCNKNYNLKKEIYFDLENNQKKLNSIKV
ncbi:MAG: hypothetical protein N4A49_09160 [Marinifilaceae bacterium]|jgi:hypothetical protein|nr:hypothetical protein [Marinifilaceae bacterium]